MKRYSDASFPPLGPWDRRLTEIACPELKPVELLHQNPWFAVRNRGGYFTMEYHLPQIIVLPVVNAEAIVMVRAKRPVLDDLTLELPAGGSEDNESPVASAARELAEETGILVDTLARFVPMPPLAAAPNRMPKLLYVFQVSLTHREFDERGAHDDEIDTVELVSLRDAARFMTTGRIYVAVPIAVISMYLLKFHFLNRTAAVK